jgi:hypothetical protein
MLELHASLVQQPPMLIILMAVLPIAVLQAQIRNNTKPQQAKQMRDAALTSSLAFYEQAVQQSQQLQAVLQTVLASQMGDTQEPAAAAADDDTAAADPTATAEPVAAAGEDTAAAETAAAAAAEPAAASNNGIAPAATTDTAADDLQQIMDAASVDGTAAAGPAAANNDGIMPAASAGRAATQPQPSMEEAFSLLQAAELKYLSHAQSLQAECSEVHQLLTKLQSHLNSLSAKCQLTQDLEGDVRACSAVLQAQLRRSRTAAVVLAPVHQQQHTELLARQQHARALQQLQSNACKQVLDVKQVKLRIEKVQDEVEALEYVLKKATKKDPAKVPSLQSKLAAARQELAGLQEQLRATQQLLANGQLQAWYPELQQQLSELLLNEYGPAAAAGAIGGLAAEQLVMGQAGVGRLPCTADYRSVQVLHRTADRSVSRMAMSGSCSSWNMFCTLLGSLLR